MNESRASLSLNVLLFLLFVSFALALIPTPDPTPSVEPSPSPDITPTPSVEITPEPTPSPEITPTPQPCPTPTLEATPTPQPCPTPSEVPTPSPTPNPSPEGSPTPTIEASPTPSVEPSASPSLEPTPSPEITPTPTPSEEPTPSPEATPEVVEKIAKGKFKIKNHKGLQLLEFNEQIDGEQATLQFNEGPVKKITLKNAKAKAGKEADLGFENVDYLSKANLPSTTSFVEVFAIDPSKLDFESASFTMDARGESFWKCKDWNFVERSCPAGGWVKLFDFEAGQTYEIPLGPTDPGYAVSNRTNGLVGYYQSIGAPLRYRTWGGAASGWGDELLPNAEVGAINWIRIACSPLNYSHDENGQGTTKQNCIMASLSDAGLVQAQVWNGSAWDSLVNITNVTSAGAGNQSFDVVFEQQTGRGMVIARQLGNSSPFYAIWFPNNRSWSSAQRITNRQCTFGNGTPTFIEAAAYPLTTGRTNEIIAVYHDSSSTHRDFCGHVWNGSAWWTNSSFNFSSQWASGSYPVKNIDVAYEQTSGDAWIVFEATNVSNPTDAQANYTYKTFNGTWGTTRQLGTNIEGFMMWIEIASRKNSNHILVGAVLFNSTSPTSDNLAWAVWNGTGTANGTRYRGLVFQEGSTAYQTQQIVDVSYIDDATGSMAIVYGSNNYSEYSPHVLACYNETYCLTQLNFSLFNGTTTNQQCGTSTGGNKTDLVLLRKDPNGKDLMLVYSTNSTSEPICTQLYNGTSNTWGALTNLEDTNRNSHYARPFDFAFYQQGMAPWYNSTAGYAPAVNNSMPNVSETVNYTSFWYDDVSLYQYLFSWNGEGAGCDTWTNGSWTAFNGFTGLWANVTKQIPAACEGRTISALIYANDSSGLINVTDYIELTVNNSVPQINAFAWNLTRQADQGETFCLNATVAGPTDTVWAALIYPNATPSCQGTALPCSTWDGDQATCNTQGGCKYNVPLVACQDFPGHAPCSIYNQTFCTGNLSCTFDLYNANVNVTLTNSSAKGTCGGNGATYSAFISTGTTNSPPNLSVQYVSANDSAGNSASNSTTLTQAINDTNPVVSEVHENPNSTLISTTICINATVTDTGSGVSQVWRSVLFPNSSVYNISLQQETDLPMPEGCDSGGGDVWAASFGVGKVASENGFCYGTPEPCNRYTPDGEAVCNSMDGCLWSLAQCVNSPGHSLCASYTQNAACSGNTTCAWSTSLIANWTYANDSVGNLGWNETSTNVSVGTPPWFTATGVNNSNPSMLETIMYNATIADNVEVSGYVFEFGGTNDSWAALTTGNNTNASVTKEVPATWEGQGVSSYFYANDSSGHWNVSPVIVIDVQAIAPVITQYAVNTTRTNPSTQICINATVTDAGIGVDPNQVWATVEFPDTTVNFNLDNSTSKGTCGGGGDVYSAVFDVGTTVSPPNLTIESFNAKDLAGAATKNTSNLGVIINPAPWFPATGVNNTVPYAGESVMHNATIADETEVSGYIFSWNTSGASCDTWVNESWAPLTTGNNTNASTTIAIPAACENKVVSWGFYANDSDNSWNVTAFSSYNVQIAGPVISNDNVNVTVTEASTTICLNATVTDAGVGVDNTTVQATLVMPDLTGQVVPLTNSSSKGTCGGGGDIYSAFISVGSTVSPPNLTVTRIDATDLGGTSSTYMSTLQVNVTIVNIPPYFPATGVNNTNPNPAESVMHNATIADDVAPAGYIFSWNATGASCDTWANDTWISFTTNNTNATTTKEISSACENQTIGWIVYANDSGSKWNSTATSTYQVANVSPSIPAMAVNTTTTLNGTSVCTNATVTDVGVGVSVVWQTITYPNGSVQNLTLSNATSIDGCGGGGSVWAQRIGVGATTGGLYINASWANDTLGNLGSNSTQLNVTVYTDNKPYFPSTGVNQSSPQPAESVMHNATIADDFGVSGYIFSTNATGTNCNTWANDSWIELTTGNNTNASVTKTIPNACENRTVGWIMYANDTIGQWNKTANLSYRVANVSPVISSMASNTTVTYRNHTICTNATVTDVGRGVSRVWQTVTFQNGTITNISLSNTLWADGCGGGGSVYTAKIKVGETLSPPDLTVNTTWANDSVGNSGSNSTAWNVTVYNYNTLAPQWIRVRAVPYNQTMNATVVVASEWSDESENNVYPNAYGVGMRGNFTVTTNATNALYSNYLQYLSSEYYGGAAFGKGTWRAQTINIPDWNAFESGSSVPPLVDVCLRMRRYNVNGNAGSINIDVYAAAANGSVNKSNKIATSTVSALTSTSYLWYCGTLNESITLTGSTNYTLVVSSAESQNANKYAVAYVGLLGDAYSSGRSWYSTNNGTGWRAFTAAYDLAFLLKSKPISSPTWKTFNASVWNLPSFMLYNSTQGAFFKPGSTEDFSNDWLWTTPIGWNYSSSGQMITVRNASSCYAQNNPSVNLGLNCLYFNDTSTTATPSIQRYFGSAPKYAQINFTMVNRNSTGALAIRFLTPTGSRLLDLVMDGYTFRYSNRTAYLTLANTTGFLNEFLNVSLSLNANTSTFNLTVNGDSVTGQRTWYARDIGGIGRIQVFTQNKSGYIGESWIANITIADILHDGRAWANYSLPTPTDAGKYNYFFNVWDTDGNTNNTNNETLCVGITDCADINSEIYSPENGAFVNGNVTLDAFLSSTFAIQNVTFQRINASNPTGSWTTICMINSSSFTRCNWDVSGLADVSTWIVNVIIYDIYGNTNNNTYKAINSTFVVDHRIPGVFNHTVTYPAGQDYARDGQSVILNLTATDFSGAGLANITIDLTDVCGIADANMTLWSGSAGSNETSNWTYTCSVTQLLAGNYTARVTATDLAEPDHNVNDKTFFLVQLQDVRTEGCIYAGYGDWTIPAGTACVFENQVLNITGNFNITGNASFLNTSVLMNSSSDGQYAITVAGNLTSSNSTFNANQTGINYKFIAESGAYFEMSNSTVSSAGIGDNDGERGLTIRTNSSIINTTNFTNNYAGLAIEDATPSLLGNNTADGNSRYGYYLRGMQNCVFYNNNASNNGGIGLKDLSGSACNYTQSFFTQNDGGASFEGTDSSIISYFQTSVNACGTACFALEFSGSQNTINHSVFNATGSSSLLKDSGNNNNFYNTNFNALDASVFLGNLSNAQSDYFNNVTFGSGGSEDVGAELTSTLSDDIIAFNSTIPRLSVDESTGILLVDSNVSEYIALSNGANVTAINTTLPSSATYTGTGNSLARQWYVDVLVQNETGTALESALVSANDTLGSLILNALSTNASGKLGSWQNITNYIETEAGLTNYTPHNFNATLAGYATNSTQSTITESKVVVLQLPATLACGITLTSDAVLVENLSSTGTCFTIGADGISVNCSGYAITGDGTGYGINITEFDSITVRDCSATNFSIALFAQAANGTNVLNNTFYNNTAGVSLNYGNATVTNNTMRNNAHAIVFSSTTANNTIENNTFTNSTLSDFNSTSANFLLYNNTIERAYGSATFLNASNYSSTNDGIDASNFQLARGFISLNTTNATTFNTTARVYFNLYSLGLASQPAIFWSSDYATQLYVLLTTNGSECPASICTGISWNASDGNLTFTVTRFSSYGIGYCGDGVCGTGESQYNCPTDCGSPPGGGNPTPTPTATQTPNATVTPTSGPFITPAASPSATPKPSAPATKTELGNALYCTQAPESLLKTTREIFVFEKKTRTAQGIETSYTTTVRLTVENQGNNELFAIELKEFIPIELGSAQSLKYSALPEKFAENNSAAWTFKTMKAGEKISVNYSSDKRLFSRFAQEPKVTVGETQLVVSGQAGQWNWLYWIIAAEIILALYFYYRTKVKKRGKRENS